MSRLTDIEKELLDVVLGVAGDIESQIDAGIVVALKGTSDKARRVYLRNILTKAAKAKIRSARKRYAEKSLQPA